MCEREGELMRISVQQGAGFSALQSTQVETPFGCFSCDRRRTKAHFWSLEMLVPVLRLRRCSPKYGHRKCGDAFTHRSLLSEMSESAPRGSGWGEM